MKKGTNLVSINQTYEVNGGTLKVIEIQSALKVLIEWQDDFRHRHFVRAGDIKTGRVSNPFNKTVAGVGYVGSGSYLPKTSKREYLCWTAMIYRCHRPPKTRKTRSYLSTKIHEPWYCFQEFAAWCNSRPDFLFQGWELDKDILFKGSKLYSPETCCFVPKDVNLLFVKKDISRGDLPIGVCKNKKWYMAGCSNKYLGIFNTVDEAFSAYKSEKESQIKEKALFYKAQLEEDVFRALMNYSVEISD